MFIRQAMSFLHSSLTMHGEADCQNENARVAATGVDNEEKRDLQHLCQDVASFHMLQ